MTIQDRPDRLGQPEVREKSSRTVKLRRLGKLVPNFSAIQRLVVEVEPPDKESYEVPINNMTAVMADEPILLTGLSPFSQYRYVPLCCGSCSDRTTNEKKKKQKTTTKNNKTKQKLVLHA